MALEETSHTVFAIYLGDRAEGSAPCSCKSVERVCARWGGASGLSCLDVPAYFWKSGLDAWKRILTLSRGATTVFACSHESGDGMCQQRMSQGARRSKERKTTYDTTGDTTCETGAKDVAEALPVFRGYIGGHSKEKARAWSSSYNRGESCNSNRR